MASTKKTLYITGKISWAKILGDPVENYNKDGREWTFEVEPSEGGIQQLVEQKLTDRIKGRGYNTGTKNQHADREPFIQLKRPEFTKDGEPNEPIRLYDENDVKWDAKLNEKGQPTNLIGNGSSVDVKLDVRDYGPGKKKGIYPIAIRVTEHVPYQASEFGAMDEQLPVTKKIDTFKQDFELDDELPV